MSPAIRLISETVVAGHDAGIKVYVCGEMAHHARQVRAACKQITAAMDELRACTARFCDGIRGLA